MKAIKTAAFSLAAALILLVILKLSHAIAWSWGWVLMPLWLPVAVFFLASVALMVMLLSAPGERDEME